MKLSDWVTNIVERNDLRRIVNDFAVSPELCWHIDRHVMEVTERVPDLSDASYTVAGCSAGVALLREWTQQVRTLQGEGTALSSPFLVIDDDWISGRDNAPPPHVYVCMAKNVAHLSPVEHPREPFNQIASFPLGGVVASDLYGWRLQDAPDGAWILRVDTTG